VKKGKVYKFGPTANLAVMLTFFWLVIASQKVLHYVWDEIAKCKISNLLNKMCRWERFG